MRQIEVGEFIEVPMWRTTGMVIDTRPPAYGSDDVQDVLIQEGPEDERGRWYHLEPETFNFMEGAE